MQQPLAGKKTYLIAAAMILYAVCGLLLGYTEPDAAITLILEALALAGLRLGIANAGGGPQEGSY